MDFFAHIDAKDAPAPETAEVKLDLRGLEKEEALKKLDAVATYCKRSGAASLYVSFDPARPGGGETLFQPVARYFKFEKLNGYVAQALPMMTPDMGAIFVSFKRK